MLSRVSLGRGNSPPARTSSTYHSGSSRHTVCTPLLYRWCAVFATIFAVFRPFSLFFVRFLSAGPRPSGGSGTRSRNTETGAGRPRGAATPTQAACGRRRTARAPRPGAPPPRAPGGAAPTGGTRARRRATAGRPARQERAEGERVHRGGYRHARAEGPTTPNPRSARGAARGAARRR